MPSPNLSERAATGPPEPSDRLRSAVTRFPDAQLHDGEKALLAALAGLYANTGAEGNRAGLWGHGAMWCTGVVVGAQLMPFATGWWRTMLCAALVVTAG